jgi:alkylation response protein AidB-like acyl-CoA dehydrogenase
VDLVFTPEQEELRDAVRRFLRDKSTESDVRSLMATADGVDRGLWALLASLGLQGLIVPERFGGSGGGEVELLIAFEEMGRALLCAPFFATVALAASLLLRCEDQQAMADYLPGIADGTTIATVALAEDTGRWDQAGVRVAATDAGATWHLTGDKHYVPDGHTADLILVAARAPRGVSVFAVEAAAVGMTRTPVKTVDQTRKLATISLRNTPARLIGSEGGHDGRGGWPAVSAMLDRASIALSAEAVGGTQHVLDMAVGYARQRVQFGRAIGSYQAIKHKCADMLVDAESARSAAYYAAWRAAADDPELPVLACIAKAFCSEAYFRAAAENIQIHGGVGFTWEHSAQLYYRRAMSSEFLLGDPVYHRELLAQRIGV